MSKCFPHSKPSDVAQRLVPIAPFRSVEAFSEEPQNLDRKSFVDNGTIQLRAA